MLPSKPPARRNRRGIDVSPQLVATGTERLPRRRDGYAGGGTCSMVAHGGSVVFSMDVAHPLRNKNLAATASLTLREPRRFCLPYWHSLLRTARRRALVFPNPIARRRSVLSAVMAISEPSGAQPAANPAWARHPRFARLQPRPGVLTA
jgi:hypothetical protein